MIHMGASYRFRPQREWLTRCFCGDLWDWEGSHLTHHGVVLHTIKNKTVALHVCVCLCVCEIHFERIQPPQKSVQVDTHPPPKLSSCSCCTPLPLLSSSSSAFLLSLPLTLTLPGAVCIGDVSVELSVHRLSGMLPATQKDTHTHAHTPAHT